MHCEVPCAQRVHSRARVAGANKYQDPGQPSVNVLNV